LPAAAGHLSLLLLLLLLLLRLVEGFDLQPPDPLVGMWLDAAQLPLTGYGCAGHRVPALCWPACPPWLLLLPLLCCCSVGV
jgi:hypothetical protein